MDNSYGTHFFFSSGVFFSCIVIPSHCKMVACIWRKKTFLSFLLLICLWLPTNWEVIICGAWFIPKARVAMMNGWGDILLWFLQLFLLIFLGFIFGFGSVKSMPSIADCNRYSSSNASTMVLILGECVLSENLTGVEGLQRRIASRSNS